MHETSPLLHFAEDALQIMALSFHGYCLRDQDPLDSEIPRRQGAPEDDGNAGYGCAHGRLVLDSKHRDAVGDGQLP